MEPKIAPSSAHSCQPINQYQPQRLEPTNSPLKMTPERE